MKILFVMVIIMVMATVPIMGCIDRDTGTDIDTDTITSTDMDHRQLMRDLVRHISVYSKQVNPDFMVIPQNGHELLTVDGEPDGDASTAYIEAIDGIGREDLFYGYEEDNVATPVHERDHMRYFMDIARNNGLTVLVTDYCSTPSLMDDSYSSSAELGYISFAADHRDLDRIPEYPQGPYNANTLDVTSLTDARNFLYLIDPGAYPNRSSYLDTIRNTDYDVIIIDLFYDVMPLNAEEVSSLKTKSSGGSRLVIAYMSIGEAEDYRYYWQDEWMAHPPSWLAGENPQWYGNYKVRYWEDDWQDIIYGNDGSYMGIILDTGFDGVYLDIIDAFEYFEGQ
ncbi:MAG: endo alpha-1,4 polygalactosaminidase [Euryarchaeota archaeon]|nr:endo alpha-1,4 polygalactosaminidase [Euryarchaeota archaeon]